MLAFIFMYERILPRFGGQEYATTTLSILVSLPDLFLMLERRRRYFFSRMFSLNLCCYSKDVTLSGWYSTWKNSCYDFP